MIWPSFAVALPGRLGFFQGDFFFVNSNVVKFCHNLTTGLPQGFGTGPITPFGFDPPLYSNAPQTLKSYIAKSFRSYA